MDSHPLATVEEPGAWDEHRDEVPSPSSDTRLPAASSLPKAKHDRKVSWDVGAFSAGSAGPPDMISNRINSTASEVSAMLSSDHVSVEDVILSNPMEDEAETYLRETLDEVDNSGLDDALMSLLGNLPSSAAQHFHAPASPGASSAGGSTSHERTTTETLWNLDSEMKHVHGTQIFDAGDLTTGGHGNADLFAVNATKLTQRVRTNTLDEVEEEKSPAERWRTLRLHVKSGSALDTKKTDGDAFDEGDIEQGIQPMVADPGVSTEANETASQQPQPPPPPQSGQGEQSKAEKKKDWQKAYIPDFRDFEEWLRMKKLGVWSYCRTVVLFLMLPSIFVAAILFYFFENPPCGLQDECLTKQRLQDAPDTALDESGNLAENIFRPSDISRQASISWMLLFFGVRQVVTFTLARVTQSFVVDFLCLRTSLFVRMTGPMLTLAIIQAKGWVFVMFFWGIYNFGLNYGDTEFARHWLYFQDVIELFNRENPSGGFPSSDPYLKATSVMVVAGFIIALKRFWVGLVLGKQTFSRYAEDLANVIKKCLLIGQVANRARDINAYGLRAEDSALKRLDSYNMNHEDRDNATGSRGPTSTVDGQHGTTPSAASGLFDSANQHGSVKTLLNEVLGAWEEPKSLDRKSERISISSIIQFRQSLSYLRSSLPFGVAFGLGDSREIVIQGAESVYKKLLVAYPGSVVLPFDAIGVIAIHPNGTVDEMKLRELIRLFRPDCDGNLSLLDFAKSIDAVYKDLRLLRASVANGSRLDKASERIINVVFYTLLSCIILSVMGIDPLVVFASMSGLLLGFSFMIGSACSTIFEGILLILLRRPYDIGDRINVSSPDTDTPGSGSPGWIVKDVDLFTTTVVYGSSNETATYSNGSLASLRIINAARSPQAFLWFELKFPIDTSYSKLKAFRGAIEKFIKARPREWVSLVSFRVTRVEVDLGFVEYKVFAKHREAWQNIGACLQSKAELTSFALEVSKKMKMHYTFPPMPVDLSIRNTPSGHGVQDLLPRPAALTTRDRFQTGSTSVDFNALMAMFEPGSPAPGSPKKNVDDK